MSNERYILEGHKAVPCEDLLTWGRWHAKENRIVARTQLENCRVSTVFLGLNHNWDGGKPELFETMIFGGPLDGEQDRYSTWEEAEAGHKAMVERALAQQQGAK